MYPVSPQARSPDLRDQQLHAKIIKGTMDNPMLSNAITKSRFI